MKIYLFYALSLLFLMTPSACDDLSLGLDERTDPQAISLDSGDLNDYFLNILVEYSKFFEEYQEYGMQVTRMTSMIGNRLYSNAYQAQIFNDGWRIGFTNILVNTKVIIPIAKEQNKLHLAGATELMAVLTWLNLVDYFGDIPYSEALLGNEKPNPKVDTSESIYADLLKRLDQAIADLSNEASVSLPSSNDLMYGGDANKWINFGNSLKIKILVQQRKAVQTTGSIIADIVASGNYITSTQGDFQFKYSSTTSPDSRHQLFANNYLSGASDYIGNTYMNYLLNDKSIRDPRLRYYLYRQQIINTTNAAEKDCITNTKPSHFLTSDPFCELIDGYWGRDHGDNSGIPPDNLARTTYGIYPVGGNFDADQGKAVTANDGVKGAGVSPILISSYVDFYLAEAALTMSTGGDAKALLESALNKSFDKVLNFNTKVGGIIDASFAASQSSVDTYINEVLTTYDAATTSDDKLAVIAKEFYLASFCNGFEAYNTYRRTGVPRLQPTLEPNGGKFIRTFKYPGDLVNRNISVSPKSDTTVKVFWDVEDDDFVQ